MRRNAVRSAASSGVIRVLPIHWPTTPPHLDGARLLVLKAAWALDVGDARGRELAAMAFAFASEVAEQATYDAIHFHGGYGFMLEHDAQLFYRRARTWARVWGDAEDGYRRAAAARYDSVLEATG